MNKVLVGFRLGSEQRRADRAGESFQLSDTFSNSLQAKWVSEA